MDLGDPDISDDVRDVQLLGQRVSRSLNTRAYLGRMDDSRCLATTPARRILAADLRGSSWPVLAETADGVRFVKLVGAGQGTPPLIAEIVVARLAEAIGLRVPRRSFVSIGPGIESLERRDELRDLLDRSVGINLGFDYLEGARMFVPADVERVSADDATAILWLDALVMNPDRTARNPNMMWWKDGLWLIDHGAALGFQYSWSDVTESAPGRPFAIADPHVLQSRVANVAEWDEVLAARLTRATLDAALAEVPDDFLGTDPPRRRAAYVAFLWKRLKAPRTFYEPMATNVTPRARAPRPDFLRR
jgi:hypothetical protein